ncbi:MAG: hypothetical protein Q9169_000810 [Polycauliona sp. 2 TL-2023]
MGAAVVFVQVHYGFGRPAWYLTDHQVREFLKYNYGEWIQTFATLMWTKISICLFLMRIPVSKAYLRPLQAGIIILVVSNVILTLLWILQCTPIPAAWDLELKEQSKCFTRGQLQRIIFAQASNQVFAFMPSHAIKLTTNEVISAISDFVFAAVPILILRKLQMRLRTKVGLSMLMGLGACCTVRTVMNYQALPIDYTYGGIPNWYWRLFEVQLGIIAACIPALRPGYNWSQVKLRTFISTHIRTNHTHSWKEQPQVQRMEQEKMARHLRAHPSNVYSDPPTMLQSGNMTRVGNPGNRDYVQDSISVDVESQRVMGRSQPLDDRPPERNAKHRPSLDVDLRPRFSLDRFDRSLERLDPAMLRTMDDAKRYQIDERRQSKGLYES